MRRNIKNMELSPFHCSCFPLVAFIFYGTAWLQRSAPRVWRQRLRTGANKVPDEALAVLC